MVQRKVIWMVATAVGLAILSSCAGQSPNAGVPPASQFQIPAVGTPMPGGHEEAVRPDLSSGQSGALIINQTGFQIQVAVSNTIATVPSGQDFLFALPPGVYEFYIYQPNIAPRVFKETLESAKLRYLYITVIAPGGN